LSQEISSPKNNGPAYGFLYILVNPAMPNVVKVGQTERHPEVRAAELSGHSGIPTPFELVYACEVNDRVAAERAVLVALEPHRLSSDREFFTLSASEARQLVERVAADYIVNVLRESPRVRFRVKGSFTPVQYCDSCGRPRSFCECAETQ
jgi:hypothetical protein